MLPEAPIKEALVVLGEQTSPHPSSYLNYGDERGNASFLPVLADFIEGSSQFDVSESNACSPENLFVTQGISHSLEILCRVLKPSSVMLESPTYFLAASIFASNGITVCAPPRMDATNGGIDLDVLEMMLDESVIPPPSAIYIIPTNNNPTGMTYSSSRREKLVRLASAHNIIIIADEVYHLLDWREDAKPGRMVTTAGADPSLTISLNSFTKIFSPGLR